MPLTQRIDDDLKQAMTAKDEAKVSTLRFLKSALKYAAMERRVEALADPDAFGVIAKQLKQRRESIEQFTKGGREDLVRKERTELRILEGYLPKQLTDAELEGEVRRAVTETGAASKKDFGRVMKLLGERLAGRADAKRLSEMVGKLLS